MQRQILNYFGDSHADYIHARGRLATRKVIELLNPQFGEKILEIGFGTGSTLVEIASVRKNSVLTGFEISEVMYSRAIKRARFCGLSKRFDLNILEVKNKIPVKENTFDKVYIESIIAIQEGKDFKNLLLEVRRVLKPNGIFIFNETVWLDSIDVKEAKRINERCKESFGIIQANHNYPTVNDWKKLLTEIGLDCEIELPVSSIKLEGERKFSFPLFRSRLYSKIGKIKVRSSSKMRKQWTEYEKEMKSIINSDQKLMEGIIIMAANHK
jgi:SAM-dependent methyltransferase